MNFEIDFYSELHQLLTQIPEGKVSIIDDVAKALGDISSKPAILEILNRKEFLNLKNKIVYNSNSENELFRNFSSSRPLSFLKRLQKNLAKKIIEMDKFERIDLVAGVDVSYKDDLAYAACVVLNNDFRIIHVSFSIYKTRFPYIPGYLSFREGPPIKEVVRRAPDFDILMVNGHGIAHPRFFGLASHVGLDLNKPTIGVTKRRLVGKMISKKDSYDVIVYKGRVVGAKLTILGKRNLYISVGHKISLDTSIEVVKKFSIVYDLPEPLRIAHILSRNFGKKEIKNI